MWTLTSDNLAKDTRLESSGGCERGSSPVAVDSRSRWIPTRGEALSRLHAVIQHTVMLCSSQLGNRCNCLSQCFFCSGKDLPISSVFGFQLNQELIFEFFPTKIQTHYSS